MTKTLIVPGLDGSPAPHWQHWWAATDPKALMVDLSDPGLPRCPAALLPNRPISANKRSVVSEILNGGKGPIAKGLSR